MAGIPGAENLIGSFAGGFSKLGLVAKFIFYGLIIGVGGYFLVYLSSFNYKVRLHLRSGDGYITKWDKGKLKKDKDNPGVYLFSMLKDKRWKAPIHKQYVSLEKRSMGRVGFVVEFIEDAEGRLQPIRPPATADVMKWTGWDSESQEFTTRNIKEAIDRYKKGDWWEKYAPLIQMGGFILIFVIMLVLFNKLEEVSESLSAVAGALQSVATSLGGVNVNTPPALP